MKIKKHEQAVKAVEEGDYSTRLTSIRLSLKACGPSLRPGF